MYKGMIILEKTQKLFYENPYLKEFKTNITDVIEKDSKYHTVLEATAFFPGGGGQPYDTGRIGNIEVIEVYEEGSIIYHVLDEKPKRLNNIICKINWEKRFDGMQQHLAQHVLSGCFYNYFNSNTVSFHLGEEISTVDIVGFLEEEKILEAEELANKIVLENYKVNMLTPTKQELKRLKLRRDIPKTNEEIRVLEIEDLDINACCGLHPNNTIELQLIKIKKWEKNKGNTRIEYIAGKRAINRAFSIEKIFSKASSILNTGEQDFLNTISNIVNKNKMLSEENNKLKNELSNLKMKDLINNGEKIKNTVIIKKIFKNEDLKYINKLINKIIENENTIVLFANINEDKVNIVFASSRGIKSIDMNVILKDAITLIDGKGGGSKNLAQGAGKSANNIDNTLDYAVKKVKALL